MSVRRVLRALRRAVALFVPPRLRTSGMAACDRVARLTPAQRDELARNLRGMLRPKAA